MEAKDITKGKVSILKWNGVGLCVGIENKPQGVYKHTLICEMLQDENDKTLADAELICEAFNVANEIGLSPRQMKERIKELEELLTESRNHFLYEIDIESGEPLADLSTLINFWGKVNNALNPKTEN
jgi:hypothetical protein